MRMRPMAKELQQEYAFGDSQSNPIPKPPLIPNPRQKTETKWRSSAWTLL